MVSNFKDWEYVDNPTSENIKEAMGRLCRKYNCPMLSYDEAKRFIPGVFYNIGMVVEVNGKERIVSYAKKMMSVEDIMDNSVPQRKSCLHKFYPYKYIGN